MRRPISCCAVLAFVAAAWFAPEPAAAAGDAIVTLKSGRAYRAYGDILVPVEAGPGLQGALTGTRWPNATLFYTFDASVSAAQRTDFRQWAAGWESGSGVRFVEDAGAPNRVLVQIAADIGCGHSVIGMIGGVQDFVIATGAGCWASGVVQHELGHALDAIHEQQRSDRDSYVTITDHGIVQHCGQGTWDANYGEVASETNTAYDYASIMHYPSPAHYTCDGFDVWADITVLGAEPAGDPPGSENACTSVADCQAIIGSPTISVRDNYGMALRYGYRIEISRTGNGSGAVFASGFLETCGVDCYLTSPVSVLTVTAFPDPDSIVTISGACRGGTSCDFSPTANAAVEVRFTKKASVAAVIAVMTKPKPDSIFANGFDGIQ
jgi:hypothetical protein